MLKLTNITKNYRVGDSYVQALKGVDLEFRKSEFVSILGPSGCGKTTLLNIIGGLDKYTQGDLLVEGKSTKSFKDGEWDWYRNNIIGFVFQSYNLISHLSVLDNVIIALTLSGVSYSERKQRATDALKEVGLDDQLHKKPSQLSGGQMQRVAIARALVNNPKILLADEPTGALDSATSIQIMELIKKISSNRLVIMVTHNSDLAQQYSDRIIRLLDGNVVDDTNPYQLKLAENEIPIATQKLKGKKTSMSYLTALKSSFKNLLSKKARTIITSIAGSIGIVGIALVLAISSGMSGYISNMQSDTLAGFPLSISKTASLNTDFTQMPGGSAVEWEKFPEGDKIFSYDSSSSNRVHINNINDEFTNYVENMDKSLVNAISYSRAIALNVIAKTQDGHYKQVATQSGGSGLFSSGGNFNEIPNSKEFINSQYDVLKGEFPQKAEDIVLILDSRNRVNVKLLETFGIEINTEYTFDDFLGKEFKVATNNDYYKEVTIDGKTTYVSDNDYAKMYNSANSQSLKIVGIMRIKENASGDLLSTGIGYTTALTDRMLEIEKNSDIVNSQKNTPQLNILTGAPFTTTVTYQSVMQQIGGISTPVGIQIYPKSFDDKEQIKIYLNAFNTDKADTDKIIYTDLAESITNTMSTMINTITIILTAFAGISLIVSSIMIGIITYVSVVERTKEIGILRSIGARKKDISRIFNAETIIIGFSAGVIGVILAVILTLPINLLLESLVGIASFAGLPILSAIILIVISVGLTFIAGLIPSRIAAKKDPVRALRTE